MPRIGRTASISAFFASPHKYAQMQRLELAVQSPVPDRALRGLRSLINSDAAELSSTLHAHPLRSFPTSADKRIRRFAPAGAAKFIGIHEGWLHQLVSEGKA